MKFKIIPNEQTPKIEIPHNTLILDYSYKMLIKFISFARRQHKCAGLAANQVSCNGDRIMKAFFAIKINNVWDLIINPKILKYSGKKEIKIEKCLTWIGKEMQVARYLEIQVNYINLKGDLFEKIVTGFQAQIWQHEYNHLMGIVEVMK